MAAISVVSCPECEKKFKPKGEVQGKKIKCPFCAHPFVVPAVKNGKAAKEDKAATSAKNPKSSKPPIPKFAKEKPGKPPPKPAAAPEAKPRGEFDSDPDPYGVKSQDLTIRCPHCAKEMSNANAVICLYCGYNTLTRERGQTEKIVGLTFDRHLKYLLPAMGAAAFAFFSIVFLLYYATVAPYDVVGTMFEFTDHESLRMWSTVIFLAWIYGAGSFCFKKFIEQPKPDEIKKD